MKTLVGIVSFATFLYAIGSLIITKAPILSLDNALAIGVVITGVLYVLAKKN